VSYVTWRADNKEGDPDLPLGLSIEGAIMTPPIRKSDHKSIFRPPPYRFQTPPIGFQTPPIAMGGVGGVGGGRGGYGPPNLLMGFTNG